MRITRHPLSFWVDKIRKMEPFSLARYGDGEWLCVLGSRGRNSNGCDYTDALRLDLKTCLDHDEPNFYHGMQRVLPEMVREIDRKLYARPWIDSEIFTDELREGALYPFIEALKKAPTVVVGNKSLHGMQRVIDVDYFIEVPPQNAHFEKERVLKEIRGYGRPAVYLFSCGLAAGTFVSELHGTIPGSSFIDIGHIWDPFCGIRSRDYLLDLSDDILRKNLCGA